VIITHIGDGLLDLWILIPLWIGVFAYGAFSLVKIRRNMKDEQLPIASVLTAVVFAFQMLNFPIAAGTSGHFLGFVLLAILISPSAAFLMITAVLTIQAFIFLDGGILALGANIFNMTIAVLPGYFLYWVIRKRMGKTGADGKFQDKGLLIGAFVGSYMSLISASFICGIEIGLSTLFPPTMALTIPLMVGYHALIAIGEAMITTFVVAFFHKWAPEYIPDIREVPVWS